MVRPPDHDSLNDEVLCRPAANRRGGLLVDEEQFVITHAEDVSIVDGLALDALALELDAVGRTHVDDMVLTIHELDQCMLARDVGILDREITRLFSAPNDEAVLVDLEKLTLVVDCQ